MSTKISLLPIATTVLLSDLVPINASGITSSVSLSVIQAVIQGAGFLLDAGVPNNLVPFAKARADGLTGQLGYVNIGMVIVPKGQGPLGAALPDSTAVGGNVRGLYSTDWQRSRTLAAQVAASVGSTINGGQNNQINASATNSTIGGGTTNAIAASSIAATIGGGNNNTLSGAQGATIAGGNVNTLSGGNNNTIGGGGSNVFTTAGSNCTIAGGASNSFNSVGDNHTISGGSTNAVTGGGSNVTIIGGNNSSNRGVGGLVSFSSGSSIQGGAQLDEAVLRATSANATPVAMSTDGSATPSAINQYILANNSAALVFFECVGRNVTTGEAGAYTVSVLVTRGASAATTAIVGAPAVTTLYESAGFAAGDFTISVDTTLGGIRGTFTGIAAVTTRSACRVRAVHVS